ncbi:alpha/beta fold hydrolase [Chitinophaga sp.]|uniref:thioesterase II family protein n=1 Tax=Chitinophaga sp. TaxID=1869181 RepID=UPI0031E1A95F
MNRPQLFLLHFAGGSRYSFDFLREELTGFELTPLELPGRGKRANDLLIRDLDAAAEDIYRQIVHSLISMQFYIYGHSMGAYLALKVTSMLERRGYRPQLLIVSGNAGPGVHNGKMRHLLDDEAFKEELRLLGGIPEEVLTNEELYAYYEPILRADFEVVEGCSAERFSKVSTPLLAMMGAEEEDVDQLDNWQQFTSGAFETAIFPGGHFFIFSNAAALAKKMLSYRMIVSKNIVTGI